MPANVVHHGRTGDAKIDGVLSGFRWDTTHLTYSFPSSRSDYEANYGDPAVQHVLPLNASARAAINKALVQIESFTLLDFTDVTGTATYPDLRFAQSKDANPAFAYYPANPATFPAGGDAFFHGGADFKNSRPGSYAFSTFMHEIGHTLGLKHGHEAEGGFPRLPRNLDSIEFSVMTYRAFIGGPVNGPFTNEKFGFPQSYMMLDIAALQEEYGANYSFNSGDTTYSWLPNSGREYIDGVAQPAPGANRIFLTVWDGGGNDTYDFSGYHTKLLIKLAPGGWSVLSQGQLARLDDTGKHFAHGNVFNALLHDGNAASLIENAIGGSGSDRIVGNVADNTLTGNRGADKLSGGEGNDHLIGGPGYDILGGGNGADTFEFNALNYSVTGPKRDWIKDFNSADGDKIDLSGIAATAGVALHFIGADPFSGTPGEIRHQGAILKLDIDGDMTADFQIKVAGLLSSGDFILS